MIVNTSPVLMRISAFWSSSGELLNGEIRIKIGEILTIIMSINNFIKNKPVDNCSYLQLASRLSCIFKNMQNLFEYVLNDVKKNQSAKIQILKIFREIPQLWSKIMGRLSRIHHILVKSAPLDLIKRPDTLKKCITCERILLSIMKSREYISLDETFCRNVQPPEPIPIS